MGRKVFISVLGASNYGECEYVKGDCSYGRTRFIQVSTLRMLTAGGDWNRERDVAYILLTDDAEKKNWADDGQTDPKTHEPIKQAGLKSCLDGLEQEVGSERFPTVVPVTGLPLGNTEDEIWQIFSIVFQKLDDGDELYFDLTHGFRYLPMLILVLGNYSKFLKNASVKSITYGNYEMSNHGQRPAPIVDLLPLSQLQDWATAAGQYLDNGNVDRLVELASRVPAQILRATQGADADARVAQKFAKNLKDTIADFQTCRGMNIIEATNLAMAKRNADNMKKTFIPAYTPIFEKIKKSLGAFSENEDIKNGLVAARWCFDNGLYQQSATMLEEYVVSFFCRRHGIDIDNDQERDIVNNAMMISYQTMASKKSGKKFTEDDWRIASNRPDKKEIVKEILGDEFCTPQLVNAFSTLSQEIRNDLNHSGMRKSRKPLEPKKIISNLRKCIKTIGTVIYDEPHAVLINLSNHPCVAWSPKQREAAERYGRIVDMEFPAIDPECDERQIDALASNYASRIEAMDHDETVTVHVMGEMTFTLALVDKLTAAGIACVASTTRRNVVDNPDGTKTVRFDFVRFRPYQQWPQPSRNNAKKPKQWNW